MATCNVLQQVRSHHVLAYRLITAAGILGEAGEREGTAGEAEEGVDTSLILAEIAQALTGLLGQGITTLGPLLACPHLRCLLSSHSHSIRKNMYMTRRVGMRSPIFMRLRHMMRLMVCMVLHLVLLLLGRVPMVSMVLMVELLPLLLFTYSTFPQFSWKAAQFCCLFG